MASSLCVRCVRMQNLKSSSSVALRSFASGGKKSKGAKKAKTLQQVIKKIRRFTWNFKQPELPPWEQQDLVKPAEVEQDLMRWVASFVVHLNLCPMAHEAILDDKLRIRASQSVDRAQFFTHLLEEIESLKDSDCAQSTVLLACPYFPDTHDFDAFLSVFSDAQAVLAKLGLQDEFFLYPFHPEYISSSEDGSGGGLDWTVSENWTFRAPHPVIHVVRRAEMLQAQNRFGASQLQSVSGNNRATMRAYSSHDLMERLMVCYDAGTHPAIQHRTERQRAQFRTASPKLVPFDQSETPAVETDNDKRQGTLEAEKVS